LHWLRTERAFWLKLKHALHLRPIAAHGALRALRPVSQYHMLTRGETEGKVTFAARAVKSVFRDIELTEGAGRQQLRLIFCLHWAPSDTFDTGLELWWDLVNVLRSDQHTSLGVGSIL